MVVPGMNFVTAPPSDLRLGFRKVGRIKGTIVIAEIFHVVSEKFTEQDILIVNKDKSST